MTRENEALVAERVRKEWARKEKVKHVTESILGKECHNCGGSGRCVCENCHGTCGVCGGTGVFVLP